MLLAKNMFFQVLGLDNRNFVVIYGLASSIYYDKIRIADMVKTELLGLVLTSAIRTIFLLLILIVILIE